MTQDSSDNGKTVAIISYLTLIGWIIALVMNNNNKTDLGSFHIRQMLGVLIVAILLSVIGSFSGSSLVSNIFSLISFIIWLLGFIGAVQGKKNPIPVVGDYFQEWFKGIG